ncbi:MAG TPA: MarR family transcriptional regulator [Firmicutes bacterium]|jgi:DNA-binding MarR family transcriptional regulator|nr:MarR family transcriptional regulator [Bacillota bacterium]
MLNNENADLGSKLIRNFWAISRMLHQMSDGRGSQKRILTVLLRSGKVTQSALTEHLGIKPGSASEVLSKLESAGLIRRTYSDIDRRTIEIELTDSGRLEAELALSEREQRKREMLAPLSIEEQEELLALLDKVIANWKEHCQQVRGKR